MASRVTPVSDIHIEVAPAGLCQNCLPDRITSGSMTTYPSCHEIVMTCASWCEPLLNITPAMLCPPWRAWTRHIYASWYPTSIFHLVWHVNMTDHVITAQLGNCQGMISTPNTWLLIPYVFQTDHVASLSREPVLDRASRLRLVSWAIPIAPSGGSSSL